MHARFCCSLPSSSTSSANPLKAKACWPGCFLILANVIFQVVGWFSEWCGLRRVCDPFADRFGLQSGHKFQVFTCSWRGCGLCWWNDPKRSKLGFPCYPGVLFRRWSGLCSVAVLKGDYYRRIAESNFARIRRVVATRGEIYDSVSAYREQHPFPRPLSHQWKDRQHERLAMF